MTNIAPSDQTRRVAAIAESNVAPTTLDLRTLFVMHAGYVWNSLRRLGVSHADLEDVTHEVFLEVQRHLGDYDASRPMRPWLFGFAFRLASAHRRRAHRRYEVVGEPVVAVAAGPQPDEALMASEQRRLVLDALESVPMDRRAVFILYEIDDVDMETVARSLGVPLNTAYSRLRVARDEFRLAVKRLRAREGTP